MPHRASALREAGLEGDHHQLCPVAGAELGHRPIEVGLRRQRADVQLGADLLVGEAPRREAHRLPLPLGQRLEALGPDRLLATAGGELLDHAPRHRGGEEALTRGDGTTARWRSSASRSLRRKPLAPARSAPNTYSSASKVVSTSTLTP